MLKDNKSIFLADNTPPFSARKSGLGASWGFLDINCCVPNCLSSTHRSLDLWFFKLPRNDLKLQWLQKIGLTELQLPYYTLVCEQHFDSNDIVTVSNPVGKKNLKKTAIPTLRLPSSSPTLIISRPKHVYQRNNMQDTKHATDRNPSEDLSQEIPQDSIDNDNQNNNHSKMEIDYQSNKCQIHNDDEQSDSDDTNNTLANKTISSLDCLYHTFNSKKENSKKQYTNEYKLKMFKLYIENIQAYELLQSTLGLPLVSSLPSFVPSTLEGINTIYKFSLIKKVGAMLPNKKIAVICISVMKIRPIIEYDSKVDKVMGIHVGTTTAPYQYAMIAMVRGIIDEWHHIVSIGLSSSLTASTEYNKFLEDILLLMLEISVCIKIIVTTTDSLFQSTSTVKCKSYFYKNYKIYHIYDPTHMKLLIYDELKHYKAFYSEQNDETKMIVRWEYIQNFYEENSGRGDDQSSHIDRNESYKYRLKSAVEMLSLNTAMRMSMFYNNSMNTLDYMIMESVDFLVRINNIFAGLYPKAYPYEHQVTRGKDFWIDNIEYIENIIKTFSKSDSRTAKFPHYLLASMNMIMTLQQTYHEENSKLMECLNHDPLVKFIEEIHSKSFKTKYPSAIELFDTLKEGIIKNNYHNIKDNVQDNKLENFIKNAKALAKECSFQTDKENCLDKTEIADQIKPKDTNSIYDVCIYLLNKMYNMYKNALSSRMKQMTSTITYENKLKNFFGTIIVPDDEFIEFVEKMDGIFVTYFKTAVSSENVLATLIKNFDRLILSGPVDTAPLQYIKEIFLELRIYQTMHYNNKLFEEDENNDVHQFSAYRLNS